MICRECGEEMERVDAPRQFGFTIPFTSIEIQVLIYGTGGSEWACIPCLGDETQHIIDHTGREAYDDGYAEGYAVGYQRSRESAGERC